MPLDPSLQRLITKAYLNGFSGLHLMELAQMRRFLTHPRLKTEQASFQDFITDSQLILRCYTPHHPSTAVLPAVIYLSATAFVIDRLDASQDYCSLLANTLGMKIINVAHRLAPEHKFPQFLDDCLESIKWVYENHQALGINHDQIALWGESSGASIAATATHVLRDQQLSYIKYQTLFYPMVDLVNPFPSKEKYAVGYMLDKPFIQWLDKIGFHPQQDRASPLVSPLLFPSFTALPPATIITAEYDPLRDEGEAYYQKLLNAGVKTNFKRFNGMIHGFMRFFNKIKAANEALDFASEHLRGFFFFQSN